MNPEIEKAIEICRKAGIPEFKIIEVLNDAQNGILYKAIKIGPEDGGPKIRFVKIFNKSNQN